MQTKTKSTTIVGELGSLTKPIPPREPGGLFSIALTSGFTLLAGLFIGYYGGRWLDGVAGTTPWLTLVGTLLGIAAGFRVLIRDVLRETSRTSRARPTEHEDEGPESD
ncbi:MAG: AtpZ/AtpI family protein [Bacillota bacterium]|nr:MAG: AtpZ/AtpI family protein [Bacillota bacterium]